MRLRTFHAADGDCLLLSSRDGHHLLVDGGRPNTFEECTWPTLLHLQRAGEGIDLVVVSHIDADHISGILWLLELVAQWETYDYQHDDAKNTAFPKPALSRPPTIKKLWHNAWGSQLGALAGPIEAVASRLDDAFGASVDKIADPAIAATVAMMGNLAESIPQGITLRRILEDSTQIARNDPFKTLVLLRDPPHVEPLGATRLTVIGPGTKHLKRLREAWRDWLRNNPAAARAADQHATSRENIPGDPGLADALTTRRAHDTELLRLIAQDVEIIERSGAANVTPPNRASITLLAEEDGRRCLLTGDAAEDELLDGLTTAGAFDADGTMWCDVIKVQHHGSENNISTQFATNVRGRHYVLSADGAAGNPDARAIKTIIESRAVDPRPFTLWFNCSTKRTGTDRKAALGAAISQAQRGAEKHAHCTIRILDDTKPYFDLRV